MRFAVLHHDHPFEHWDLLLESGPVCRTWRLLASPDTLLSASPGGSIPAEPLGDHRRHYLTYAGPVSGGRGTVTGWDRGGLVWITAVETQVEVLVSGERWRGRLRLTRGDETAPADSAALWRATLEPR